MKVLFRTNSVVNVGNGYPVLGQFLPVDAKDEQRPSKYRLLKINTISRTFNTPQTQMKLVDSRLESKYRSQSLEFVRVRCPRSKNIQFTPLKLQIRRGEITLIYYASSHQHLLVTIIVGSITSKNRNQLTNRHGRIMKSGRSRTKKNGRKA